MCPLNCVHLLSYYDCENFARMHFVSGTSNNAPKPVPAGWLVGLLIGCSTRCGISSDGSGGPISTQRTPNSMCPHILCTHAVMVCLLNVCTHALCIEAWWMPSKGACLTTMGSADPQRRSACGGCRSCSPSDPLSSWPRYLHVLPGEPSSRSCLTRG